MTTSQPFSCNTLAVAALVSGYIASATQPRKRATRARLGPMGGRTSGNRAWDPESRGSMAIIRRKVGGSSLVIPQRSAKSSKPIFWNSRAGASAALTRPA